jgi:hypothetical protein
VLTFLSEELEYLAEQLVQFEDSEFQRLISLITEKFPGNDVDHESAQAPGEGCWRRIGNSTRSSNFLVNKPYTGTTHEFLTARPGDPIIVHAWIQGKEAIGYN